MKKLQIFNFPCLAGGREFSIFKIILFVVTLVIIAGIVFFAFYKINLAKKASIKAELPPNIKVGETIGVPIFIDTKDETINAAEIYLEFNPEEIEIISVSKDESFFELWITDEPKFSNEKGEISFAGGLPTPGLQGKGQVGSIEAKPLKKGTIMLTFDSKTRILRNDGLGTTIEFLNDPIVIKTK